MKNVMRNENAKLVAGQPFTVRIESHVVDMINLEARFSVLTASQVIRERVERYCKVILGITGQEDADREIARRNDRFLTMRRAVNLSDGELTRHFVWLKRFVQDNPNAGAYADDLKIYEKEILLRGLVDILSSPIHNLRGDVN